MKIAIIVASAENGVIGAGGRIPWRAREEQARFKAATMGHTVIMGRRTVESLPRPLQGRQTIMVSASGRSAATEVAPTLEAAIELSRSRGAPLVFIGGGARLFAESYALADIIYHTIIHLAVDGDVQLPPIPADMYQEIWLRSVTRNPAFTYRTLLRRGQTVPPVDGRYGIADWTFPQ